jgi:calcineurin-like phosphoesterase family protein
VKTWFTSDTHWSHTNIIHYARRPFTKLDGQPDVEAMNEALIANWNARVHPQDRVWHLGDLFLGKPDHFIECVRPRLNGDIHLVLGNHDRLTNTQYRRMGIEPHKRERLWHERAHVLMVHNVAWVQDILGAYDLVLCGHVHELWRERIVKGKRCINVGVDVRGFRPVSLEELLEG